MHAGAHGNTIKHATSTPEAVWQGPTLARGVQDCRPQISSVVLLVVSG